MNHPPHQIAHGLDADRDLQDLIEKDQKEGLGHPHVDSKEGLGHPQVDSIDDLAPHQDIDEDLGLLLGTDTAILEMIIALNNLTILQEDDKHLYNIFIIN